MSLENKHYSDEMKLMDKIRDGKRICNYPGCNNPAINSHILQENGILNWIADDKKTFMEHTPWSKFRPEEFYPASINKSKMFTFKGFCNSHDTTVFKEIENGNLNFSFYNHNLLFSYRGLLNDLYSALVSRDFANKALYDNRFPDNWKDDYRKRRNREQLKVNELTYYKWIIEQEIILKQQDQQFVFHHFSLPKLELATSTIYGGIAIYGVKGYLEMDYTALRKIKADDPSYKPACHPIFINLIPSENNLSFILGYVSTLAEIETIPVRNISSLGQEEILRLLSQILPKLEVWGMSRTLYKKWKSEGKIDRLLNVRASWNGRIIPFRTEAELKTLKENERLNSFSLVN
jgi:hypothetical protein